MLQMLHTVEMVCFFGSKGISTLQEKMSIKNTIVEFCDSTSLHGLGFITNKKLSLAERLAWLLIFLCSVSYAAINLKQATEGRLSDF